jgi:hypothetical protein
MLGLTRIWVQLRVPNSGKWVRFGWLLVFKWEWIRQKGPGGLTIFGKYVGVDWNLRCKWEHASRKRRGAMQEGWSNPGKNVVFEGPPEDWPKTLKILERARL